MATFSYGILSYHLSLGLVLAVLYFTLFNGQACPCHLAWSHLPSWVMLAMYVAGLCQPVKGQMQAKWCIMYHCTQGDEDQGLQGFGGQRPSFFSVFSEGICLLKGPNSLIEVLG